MSMIKATEQRARRKRRGKGPRHHTTSSQRQRNSHRGIANNTRATRKNSRRQSRLARLFPYEGMDLGSTILRSVGRDYFLFCRLRDQGIESKESVEHILLQLLFESRIFAKWSVTDGLVEPFLYIQKKLEWASDIPVLMIIQLLHSILRARVASRLACENSRKGAVADRVDKLVKWMNGADHLMVELENFVQLTVPMLDMASEKKKREVDSGGEEDMQDDGLLFQNGLCINAAEFGVNTRRHRRIAPPPRSSIVVPQLQWPTRALESTRQEHPPMNNNDDDDDNNNNNNEDEEGFRPALPLQRPELIVPTSLF